MNRRCLVHPGRWGQGTAALEGFAFLAGVVLHGGAWDPVAVAVFAMAFAVPFLVLLSRAVKTWAPGLAAVAAVVFAGMWLERFILVAPSLWHGEGVPLGLLEAAFPCGPGPCIEVPLQPGTLLLVPALHPRRHRSRRCL